MRSDLLPRLPFATRPVGALAAIKLLLGFAVLAAQRFGVHRDEFLYFSMGAHLRLWRMDFPPAIALLANASRALFGESLAVVRVFPTVEGAILLVLAAMVARELGGGRWAQALAALGVLASPLFLRAGILFQPVVLDQIWWTLALLFLAIVGRALGGRIVDDRMETRGWIGLGFAMGLGLLTKFSILFLGVGIFSATILTSLRRTLTTRWPWVAAITALIIGSPSMVGQVALGYPVIGQMRDLAGSQLAHVTWSAFIVEQVLMIGPVAFAAAVAGEIALLAWRPLRPFQMLAVACLIPFVILLLLHGKSYYAGPIYPTLLAAGSVLLERAPFALVSWPTRVLRWGTAVGIAGFGLMALPVALPLLSPAMTAAYADRLGVSPALRTNQGEMDRLPQDFADMVGWQEQVRAVAAVYHGLPLDEQREAVVVAGNYGEAGAAEFYGSRYGLPRVVSPVGSFWFFGPGAKPGRVAIVVGDPHDLQAMYGNITEVAEVKSPWSVSEERNVPIYVARSPRMTLQQAWPGLAGQN